ncbi:hypothetical protein FQB35_14140 [Crassaminicella thermophila]|uniref:Uncharacterized protein n=1 Tax=Crassaminicella thermophila TaxID=2599308 RepID=A0A5C0SJB8_CRATE|nr:hypothetical protein [Crassaminicella thermophila]QEK13318.1 hypothetical protein FQB35_14140 [Crassaminicella thermophila]
MCIRIVSLSIKPKEVLELLMRDVDGDLIHHEYHEIEDDIGFGYVVIEKFYTMPKHEKMIVVNTENLDHITNATIIVTPDYEEWVYHFDLESYDVCMDEIMEILDEYILEEREE